MAVTGLTIILQSKAVDRIHYALMLAAANAALDAPTTLFFATEAVEALTPGALGALKTSAGEAGAAYLARLEQAGVASPADLLEALTELEAELAVCDTALAAAGLAAGDLDRAERFSTTGLTDILARGMTHRLVYV